MDRRVVRLKHEATEEIWNMNEKTKKMNEEIRSGIFQKNSQVSSTEVAWSSGSINSNDAIIAVGIFRWAAD